MRVLLSNGVAWHDSGSNGGRAHHHPGSLAKMRSICWHSPRAHLLWHQRSADTALLPVWEFEIGVALAAIGPTGILVNCKTALRWLCTADRGHGCRWQLCRRYRRAF